MIMEMSQTTTTLLTQKELLIVSQKEKETTLFVYDMYVWYVKTSLLTDQNLEIYQKVKSHRLCKRKTFTNIQIIIT